MDPRRFDALTRSLAAPKTRRGLLGTLAAIGAGLATRGAAGAQCANVSCRTNPGRCGPGCVCCIYGNRNSRCTAPGSCSGTPTCPPGRVPDPVRGCVDPCSGPGTCPQPAATSCQVATCSAGGLCGVAPATDNAGCGGTNICCGGACVASTTATNCGACGTPCPAGNCSSGTCIAPSTTTTTTTAAPTTTTTTTTTVAPCPFVTTRCGEACVDTFIDTDNCGACGNACPAGEGATCLLGTCCQGLTDSFSTCSATLPCCSSRAACQGGRCCGTTGFATCFTGSDTCCGQCIPDDPTCVGRCPGSCS